jgi:hypothetical protein
VTIRGVDAGPERFRKTAEKMSTPGKTSAPTVLIGFTVKLEDIRSGAEDQRVKSPVFYFVIIDPSK